MRPTIKSQAILDPSFLARVEGPVELELLGHLQQRVAGPVFLGGTDLNILGGARGHDVAAEGGLEQFEFLQRQPGQAPVVGMFDFAVLAVGGADEAHRMTSVGLDFEMKPGRVAYDGYYITPDAQGSQD
jgi:hypothetical protein